MRHVTTLAQLAELEVRSVIIDSDSDRMTNFGQQLGSSLGTRTLWRGTGGSYWGPESIVLPALVVYEPNVDPIVRTVAEVTDLPVGTVLRDADNDVALRGEHNADGDWSEASTGYLVHDTWFHLPAVVLYRPTEEGP